MQDVLRNARLQRKGCGMAVLSVLKRVAELVTMPYAEVTKLQRRFPNALNRGFLFVHQPKFEFAQSVRYPRGPQSRCRLGNTLGIFIFWEENYVS